MREPTHHVRFYGIKCFAYIDDYSFEIIGRNKITNHLLGWYSLIVLGFINASSYILSLLNIDHESGFRIYVMGEKKQ